MLVTAGAAVLAEAEAHGHLEAPREFGVRFVSDTCWCMLDEPVVPPHATTLVTNSAKYAHYAPGLVGRSVVFAGLAGCIEAAVSGRTTGALPRWLR